MKGAVLKLKKGREKSIINRHPWIFSGAVANEVRAEEGDVVKVISDKEAVLGYGFYSQKSQISCRMFYWGNDEVDFNTEEFWLDKLNKAFQLRKETVISSETNAYRLVHAEGDNLPGLIIDVYAEVTVLQVLVKGMEIKLPLIVSSLLKLGFANIYLKSKTSSTNIEDIRTQSQWLTGGIESPATIKENGLAFKVDFVDGQKTGFFLDQRSNRQLLQSYSKNKKVLNAFSYTGGFSVYALAGGAEEVISLDSSEEACRMAEENIAINGNEFLKKHKIETKDCFEYLREMPENYFDLIVLDPPAFAKHARAVDNAARGYKQINMRAFSKIKAGGILFTFSCSQNISQDLFTKIVFGAAADVGRHVRVIHRLHQPADHPISIFHPEGEYLKGLVLWVE